MEMLKDADIDPAPLMAKRVAIVGFGNQGRAQALNDVVDPLDGLVHLDLRGVEDRVPGLGIEHLVGG